MADKSSEQRVFPGISSDIIERKQAQEALRESENFNRAVLRSLPAHIAVLDKTGTIYAVNEAWERFARDNGNPSATLTGVGSNYLEVCRMAKGDSCEGAPQALAGIESVLNGSQPLFTLEYPCHSPARERWFRLYATPLSDEHGGAVVSHIDITERKRMEQALEERLRFEKLLSELSATFVNLSAAQLDRELEHGLQRVVEFLMIERSTLGEFSADMSVLKTTHSYAVPGIAPHAKCVINDKLPWYTATLRRGEVVRFSRPDELPGEALLEKQRCRETGIKAALIIPLSIGGSVVGALSFACFNTERSWSDELVQRLSLVGEIFANALARKRAEVQAGQRQAELAHVARLATMGEMAAGIAHELNQPLAVIATYTDIGLRIVRSGIEHPDELIEMLEKSCTQAFHASEIIQRIRQFVSKRSPQKTDIDLNELVQEMVQFIEAEARQQDIKVQLELSEYLPTVSADNIQIGQVLLNLMRNGIEALQLTQSEHRELLIRTRLDNDGAIQVAVADTGPGLDMAILGQLFEPFFTTKATGLGMGLSISRSIIEAHGGRLWAESEPAHGAIFFFTLPVGGSTF